MSSDPESNPPGRGLNHSDILNIVLVYAVFGALWIFLSDKIVAWFFTDRAEMTLYSMIKGWFYVAFTSLWLYILMHRWLGQETSNSSHPERSRRVVWTFALLAAIIVTLTGVAIFDMHMQHREMALARLQTVAHMKSDQIRDWLRERQADAEFVRSSRYLVEQYQRWQDSGDTESGELLKSRLKQFCADWRFSAVTLLDSEGRKLWSSDEVPRSIAPDLQSPPKQTLADSQVRLEGPYRDTANKAQLDFVTPLAFMPHNSPRIILHTDLAHWLLPILKLWPIPGSSGEVSLFRFDKGQTFYLNDVHEAKNIPAKLSIPELTKDLLTVPTVNRLSQTVIEGLDYRGVAVMAVVNVVPGTDWFLASKINKSELYANTLKDAIWIGSVGLLSLFMIATGFHIVLQHQQLTLAKVVQDAQSERMNALNLLANIAETSSDAIFAKDLEGRYILFNKAAGDFVGKPANEVLGHDDRSLFPLEQAEKLMAIGRSVISGESHEVHEEVLSTAKGERIFLATKGPLRNSDGAVMGIFGISRDITEMKRIETDLRQSEERLRFALDAGKDGLFDFNIRSGLAYLSPRYCEMVGCRPEEGVSYFDFFQRHIHPDDLNQVMEIVTDLMQGKNPTTDFEYRLINAYSQITWVRNRACVAECDENGLPLRVVGMVTDITASKITEESLLNQANELAERNEELERFNRATVGRELDMIELKKQVNDLSLHLGLQPPYRLNFLEPASSSTKPAEDMV